MNNDISRCAGQFTVGEQAEVCPIRDTCERHIQVSQPPPRGSWLPIAMHLYDEDGICRAYRAV